MKILPFTIAGLLLATGCSSAQTKLAVSDDVPASVCRPANTSGEFLVAMNYLHNEGKTPAEITKVELDDPTNLKLQGFGIISNEEVGTRGAGGDLQLDTNRVIAAGDTAAIQVELGLNNTTESGTAKSLKVTYNNPDEKDTASLTMMTALEVLPAGQTCK
jgi:hypothetical protein